MAALYLVDGADVQSLIFSRLDRIETIVLRSGASLKKVAFEEAGTKFFQNASRDNSFPKISQQVVFENDGIQNTTIRAINRLAKHCNLHVIVELIEGQRFYMGISYFPDRSYYWESANTAMVAGSALVDPPGGRVYTSTTLEATTAQYAPEVAFDITQLSIEEPPPPDPPVDNNPPAAISFLPADDAVGVSNTPTIRVTFNEPVRAAGNGGELHVRRFSDDALVVSLNVDATNLVAFDSVANTMTVIATVSLAYSTEYYILVDSDAVEDEGDNLWGGVPTKGDWSFTVRDTPDTTPPSLSTLTPPDNQINVAVAGLTIAVELDEDIIAGAGNVFLYDYATDALLATYDINTFTFNGDTFFRDISADVTTATQYYILIPSGVVTDLEGNAWAGIAAKGDWDFTTEVQDPPVASNLVLFSGAAPPQAGELTTWRVDISDDEADPIDTSNVVEIYTADDALGTNKSVSPVFGPLNISLVSGDTYDFSATADAAHVGKYYIVEVTPKATVGASPGTMIWAAYGPVAPGFEDLLTLPINILSPTLVISFASGKNFRIDWGDSNVDEETGTGSGVSYPHTYGGAGTYNVLIRGVPADFLGIDANAEGVTGAVVFHKLGENIKELNLGGNSGITSFSVTALDGNKPQMTDIRFGSASLTSLDLSSFECDTTSGCIISTSSATSLVTLTLPTEGKCSQLNCSSNDALTTLNNADLLDFVGVFQINPAASLTNYAAHMVNTSPCTEYTVNSTSQNDHLDLSNLTVNDKLRVSNTSITQISLKSSTAAFTWCQLHRNAVSTLNGLTAGNFPNMANKNSGIYYFHQNSLSQAGVDAIANFFDAITASEGAGPGAYTGRILKLESNTAPSAGVIAGAIANLTARGFTVTHD